MKNNRWSLIAMALVLVVLMAVQAVVPMPDQSAEPQPEPEAEAPTQTPQPEPQESVDAGETVGTETYDVVIYGGGLQAVAAAAKAARNVPDREIALIAPYPTEGLGGISTLGGQNFWDVRAYNGVLHQGGSFAWWYNQFPNGYNTKELSGYLMSAMAGYDNIQVYYCTDIMQVYGEEREIQAVLTAGIHRNRDGIIQWGDAAGRENPIRLEGEIFLDCSEDGKLTRLAGQALETDQLLTTGRYDWPTHQLSQQERDTGGVAYQQAATMMFKISGVEPGSYDDMAFEGRCAWGGNRAMTTSQVIIDFNDRYGPKGFMIKALNMAADGSVEGEWWVNSLLLFNVDGRANERDKETGSYPGDLLPGSRSTDEAWRQGRDFLTQHADEVTEVLRQFQGMESCELVLDDRGNAVVGDILYLRETVHLAKDSAAIENGAEDNYAVTAHHSINAGDGSGLGADAVSYQYRIGLGFYQTDIHPYLTDDLTDGHGTYMVVSQYAMKARSDLTGGQQTPENPVYIPYSALVTEQIDNLLVAGYASGISSVAWSELRTFPNLIVLGDAAGVAAAYCLDRELAPNALALEDIQTIREVLRGSDAILEKHRV